MTAFVVKGNSFALIEVQSFAHMQMVLTRLDQDMHQTFF